MEQQAKLQCQRIGCNATFTEDQNPEGSCRYHASPLFHDGTKEWSCCKKRSHDFSLFLEIPGCTTGKHTTGKPVLAQPVLKPHTPSSTLLAATGASAKGTCARCRQGFFCSDHGTQVKTAVTVQKEDLAAKPTATVQVKKAVDITADQTCKNKGCGKTFQEINNHDSACEYHPGPAVFHDRLKGWKCCEMHVNEFDEFMSIPPCAKGWHSADPTP
uniref:CHORD domain-containing protein n=1 Tax=Kalanchoe fedtschenkoi TaxID=63787 RepID=A0A7N0TG41_KALFE